MATIILLRQERPSLADFISLPAYAAGPPAEPRSNWAYIPKTLSAASATAVERLKVMTRMEGLTGVDLLTTFVAR